MPVWQWQKIQIMLYLASVRLSLIVVKRKGLLSANMTSGRKYCRYDFVADGVGFNLAGHYL